MKYLILLCIIVQTFVYSYAQKYDYNWLVGQNVGTPPAPFNNTHLIFSDDSVKLTHDKTLCNFSLSLSISFSDSLGNFIFYSDGCKIVGIDNQILSNGDGLNPGEIADSYCGYGYPIACGGLVLPSPGKVDEFDFLTYFIKSTDQFGTRPVNLLNNHISFKSGKGIVESKNISILADTFTYGNLSACKQANGQDWWIVVPHVSSNEYYQLALTKDGFLLNGKQSIGPVYNYISDWSGQSVFSPNGKKYARFDQGNPLTILDFNRCDGTLSNPIHLDIVDSNDTLGLGCGLAFSASSRFLYVLSGCLIYQFDMEDNDILASKTIVDNGWDKDYTANFFLAQLGPDNKIYMSSASADTSLHVIEYPDLKGKACNVKEYGLTIFDNILGALPFYPNYRLGSVECDTMNSTNNEKVEMVKLFPNPCYGAIRLKSNKSYDLNEHMVFELYGISGSILLSEKLDSNNNSKDINLSKFSSGFYIWQLKENNLVKQNGKLILIK